ncbi:MAG: hypothetical protein Kow0092_16610 [Deferrisomatales bacterium]
MWSLLPAVLLLGPVGSRADVDFGAPISSDLAGPGVGDGLVGADFNGDCAFDLVTTRDETVASETGSLIVRFGDGVGGFPDGGNMDGGRYLTDAALADLNRDGVPDLAVAESFEPQAVPTQLCRSQTPQVPVFLGDGVGGFVFQGCAAAKDHPNALVPGDFDEDGNPDLIVVNAPSSCCGATSRDAVLLRGRGDGTFRAATVAFRRRGTDAEAADFDGDRHLDLAIAAGSGTFVYLGAGDGTFVQVGTGIAGPSEKVAVGDLDGDGAPDLVAVGSSLTDPSDDVVWVALNRGDGTGGFAPARSYAVGSHPLDVASSDLDRDGRDDVVVANYLSDDVSVFLAEVDGSLSPPRRFPAGSRPTALLVADLDRNGYPDLLVSNRNEENGELADGQVSALLQQVALPLGVGTECLPAAVVGRPYAACLTAFGGTPPYTWRVAGGSWPAEMSFDGRAGRISGTPGASAVGDYGFDLSVDDLSGATSTRPLRLAVVPIHGDLDGDGDVDRTDLRIAARALGAVGCGQGGLCERDLDGDGDLDGSDLAVLGREVGWSDSCGAPP